MKAISLGFIGGGRVVRIYLAALQHKGIFPERIVISDPAGEAREVLMKHFPDQNLVLTGENSEAARQDIVFLAVHPPVMKDLLPQIGSHLTEETLVVSLVPKFTFSMISELLGGHKKLVRMIPNAPSWKNIGFNPTAFAPDLSASDRQQITELLGMLGRMPEVGEDKLEAYAILTAMGPTYFWFQFDELQRLSQSFGLTDTEFKTGLREMLSGAMETLFDGGLNYEEVVDLIPVKPIGDQEEQIREIYRSRLTTLYQKLSGSN
ncbi:MAG TPA: NAD(P)-binding domain-containing protein [Calditrichia bacterium]|nr:NAD(P)-binding domain-containing protein [Calditrichota bacterium]HQV32286.1 NAD(P)-binding domain-containing protein [Calditrichia bacterium]